MGTYPTESGRNTDPPDLHRQIQQFGKKSGDHAAVVDSANNLRPNVVHSDLILFVTTALTNLATFDNGQLPDDLRKLLQGMGCITGIVAAFRAATMWLTHNKVSSLANGSRARFLDICSQVREKIPALINEINFLEKKYPEK